MNFHPSHIEIFGGIVRDVTITDANGSRSSYEGIGGYHFFVDVVKHDGGRMSLWSGLDYEDAIRQAEAARKDFGLDHPVRDSVAGTH